MINKLFIVLMFIFSIPLLFSETELVSWINNYRVEQGLDQLFLEQTLNKTAEKYAAVLLSENKIRHTDKEGNRVLNRYRAEGGTAWEAGEILGTGSDLSDIFFAWLNSESHNSLILNNKWLRIGTAIVENKGIYVTVVLFSTSSIDEYSIFSDEGTVNLYVKNVNIENNLYFLSNLKRDINNNQPEQNRYLITLKDDELPLLISVSTESDGDFKKSDFIYIGDVKKEKTY